MTFTATVPEDEATGEVAAIYAGERESVGYVRNLAKGFSLRPDVYAAWMRLNGAIKANMELRRYEVATVAAAGRLRSSYCSLAHGSILNDLMEPAGVRAVVTGDTAALGAVDAAVVELADKVVRDATTVTEADVERLRGLGLSDADILDVVLAAAARCFFSKVLDGLGIAPDAQYAGLDPELRDALTVGRAIAAG